MVLSMKCWNTRYIAPGEQWKMNSRRERRTRFAVCAVIGRSVIILTRYRAKVARLSSVVMLWKTRWLICKYPRLSYSYSLQSLGLFTIHCSSNELNIGPLINVLESNVWAKCSLVASCFFALLFFSIQAKCYGRARWRNRQSQIWIEWSNDSKVMGQQKRNCCSRFLWIDLVSW